ncbi:hypothetical protein IFR04_015819 [Cadophora malorum]|uniref:Uncharacterized protein n=1 Tax=Cadophora malorum TaxID=108018 RepID=A0A8H7W4Y0_9HELO|nr:hypothetical protein IFR04_015819 [Cadophora malorum]
MFFKTFVYGPLALTYLLGMVTALTTPYYLNATITASVASIASPSEVITVPDQGEVPPEVDPGLDISSTIPAQSSPTSAPVTPTDEPNTALPIEGELLDEEDPTAVAIYPFLTRTQIHQLPYWHFLLAHQMILPSFSADEELFIDDSGLPTDVSIEAEPADPVIWY